MRHTLAFALLALLVAGCHSTSSLHGRPDGAADSSVDTMSDGMVDTTVDTRPDTPVDALPSDAPPGTCPDPTPAPDGPLVSFTIDGGSHTGEVDLTLDCLVLVVENLDETTWFITLHCPGPSGETERYQIQIDAWPNLWLPLWEGEGVTLRYVETWWGMGNHRWFALSYPEGGGLVVGGADATTPAPPSREDFFWPVGLWGTDEDWCPVEGEGCYAAERIGMIASLDAMGLIVYDSTMGYIGEWDMYGVYADMALDYMDEECDDVPDTWYSHLVFMTGWD
jgi:hypothetical protein